MTPIIHLATLSISGFHYLAPALFTRSASLQHLSCLQNEYMRTPLYDRQKHRDRAGLCKVQANSGPKVHEEMTLKQHLTKLKTSLIYLFGMESVTGTMFSYILVLDLSFWRSAYISHHQQESVSLSTALLYNTWLDSSLVWC